MMKVRRGLRMSTEQELTFERHLAFIDWREQVFYTIDAVIFAKFEVGIVSPNTFHF